MAFQPQFGIVSVCAIAGMLSACATEKGSEGGDAVLPSQPKSSWGECNSESETPRDVMLPPAAGQLDLLLMIDNSISMSDKQQLLRQAVPDLLQRLTHPVCIDAAGNQLAAPAPGQACPEGQRQQFPPLTDIHVGIVTSSLGDVGANVACPTQRNHPKYAQDRVDMAHLMGSLERSTTPGNAQGFLEWRAGETDVPAFALELQDMVSDVGEAGCGWEASLESWYRFLVDPVPYRELARVPCRGSSSTAFNCVQPATDSDNRILLDEVLLAQRAAFLRPNSLLAIVMLTDENDCSAQAGNQTWVTFNIADNRPMFRGSSVCETNPNDQCCYSCPLEPPAGCAPDPACTAGPDGVRLPEELDGQNLRCFAQKRRFGFDALYPTQRYVNALTQPRLCWNAPDLAVAACDECELFDNPLFAGGRSPSHVFLTGILGVPWQPLAASSSAAGLPLAAAELRLQSYDELTRNGVWDQILGSPGGAYAAATSDTPRRPGTPPVPPTLPQMVESTLFPRPGVDAGNDLNGRDYDTTQGTATQPDTVPRADDLQYACIFPLPEPRDCAALDPEQDHCDCFAGVEDRALCEQVPGSSTPGTTQYWGKAYPGLRQLQVLKDVGAQTSNSVVASICARNTAQPALPDFGYRPAMAALVERLQSQLEAR